MTTTGTKPDTTATTATTATADAADAALKGRHRAMWALGDYPRLSRELIHELGPVLVDAAGVSSGTRVLDVAAGTGNVAIPAALRGADVTASDLTPELLDAGRAAAEHAGAVLRWEQGDAEALPYPDGQFDAVLSCVGVMFAPHHQRAADELLRVCRPGGTIGLVSWTPSGFIGRLFATMKPYAPPPPPGASPPPLWGDEAHVRELFGDRVDQLDATRRTVRIPALRTAEQFRDYFRTNYGPTIAAYRGIADDPERVAALDRDLVDLARPLVGPQGADWEYLLVVARRAGGTESAASC